MKDAINVTDAIILVYADKQPHTNTEVYDEIYKWNDRHKMYDTKEKVRHSVRRFQNRFQARNLLEHIDRGIWQLNPDIEVLG